MSIRCPEGVLRALDEFCSDQRVSRSVAVRDAVINELRLAGYWPRRSDQAQPGNTMTSKRDAGRARD